MAVKAPVFGHQERPLPRLSLVLEEEEGEKEDVTFAPPPAVKTLDWNEVYVSCDLPAIRHSLHFQPDEHVNWTDLNLKHTQQDTTIRLTRTCFAKGALRSAHAIYDCKMDKYLVAKMYFGKAAASKKSLDNDVKMQIVAKRLATEFSLSEDVENGVDFIFTCWYEIKDPLGAGLSSSKSMFTAEPYIEGEYKKFNNNNGWRSCSGLNRSDSAQAFSHFTWQKTLGQLMVVDLQGVGCIFTDPQIHSKQGNDFGCGNLSDAGMAAFFVTHECNNVCRALALKPFKCTGLGADNAMEKVTKVANKSMTCSCPLCGGITIVSRGDFIHAYREGREVYCEPCVARMKTKLRLKCRVCKKTFMFSPYWHAMKGIATPTSCKSCVADDD